MKTIGLTGSIGMGKTETAKLFAQYGVPIFDSDAAVHKLLGPKGDAVDAVELAFPDVKKQDHIDRKLLGARVFGDDDALKTLEEILHPLVVKERKKFTKNSHADIVLFDIPLLFEKGYEDDCDYIVVVSAPFETQKKRVLKRPGMTETRFEEILAKQLPDLQKRTKADFVVQTDRGLDYAAKQVEDILQKIKEQ
jgi:dephospho-CoA kinase|tara:strand:- start:44605 stop:45186 length:582 start_codon:yes stop_codon:yes gene_type:complete